jgi:hypothetical protein
LPLYVTPTVSPFKKYFPVDDDPTPDNVIVADPLNNPGHALTILPAVALTLHGLNTTF